MMNNARLILAILSLALFSDQAKAAPVLADLSKYAISIDSGFTGTDVLLYGAVDEEGDLVVVVRGPDERVSIRRKDRVAGIWVNQDEIEFRDAPSYYLVASRKPLDEIAPRNFRELHQIGLDALKLTADSARPEEEVEHFREALVRNRRRDGLYSESIGAMKQAGGILLKILGVMARQIRGRKERVARLPSYGRDQVDESESKRPTCAPACCSLRQRLS